MSKILINKESVNLLLDKFFSINSNIVKKEVKNSTQKIICKFYINRKECQVDIHYCSDGINVIGVGKNKELAAILIRFLEEQGVKDNKLSKQIVIEDISIWKDIVEYIKIDFVGKIECLEKDNRIIFKGFNNDKLTMTRNCKNIVLQGKPYYVFNIVLTFIAELDAISFDDYVSMCQQYNENAYSSNIIRESIKGILKNSYQYMEEAQLKSISGAYSFINKNIVSEDYSAPLTGVFKALEGFIKKLLTQQFGFKLKKQNATMSPFRKDKKTKMTEIDLRTDISIDDKKALYLLYEAYCDKRNVYSHSTVDPSQMKIIENYKEAEELRTEVLETIEKSYNIIFKV